ncbi:MAG: hypothetical protein EZS28_007753 [Streblomastix strix]|uniref:Uncharacterized protein n=1 Tax=Streblomastix strix TaxID=222440 RepID=A0A5J4WQ87_9EUKA|nr:MAG: hypothetical protein EZS28_007753 [Streblomastix strix]
MEIPAADRQLLPPLQKIDALASGFQLQVLQLWELSKLTTQHILEGNLTEAVIGTVSGLVLALRLAESANMARIILFSGINAHLFDGNNNSVMSHANLATTQRQIGIQQLTSGQNVANVQGNLIGANTFLNLQPPQRRAIRLFNTATLPQLNQQNSGLPDLSVNRQQQITSTIFIIQNTQQQGADSEGSQTQRQNTIARNSHTLMEIDIESERRDINTPTLEAKINQPSFNRQRDYWATKSYLLKFIGKPGACRHHPGYGEGQMEVQEVLQRHTRGETISIADWRKFWKELNTDLKLDTVRLQSPVSESEEQSKEKYQSTGFWNNPRKRYRQDDRSNSGGNNQNSQLRYNTRDDFRSQGRGQRGERGDYRGRGYRGNGGGRNRDSWATDTQNNGNNCNLFSVAPWPPVELVQAITSNTVVPDLTQREIGAQIPQMVRTPDSWKSNKTPTPKQQSKQPTPTQSTTPSISTSQSSETTSFNIIPIPILSVQQVQQEQGHLPLPPVAVSPPPINPANIGLPPVLPDAPDTRASITTQPRSLELRTQQKAQRLHNEWILQENRARNEYRIHMHQTAQNKAQQYLTVVMLMNLEARSKGFDNLSYNPFGNFQPNFNPNQYIDDLSQIPSQDQQEYFNELNQYQMQRDDDHDSNDDVFGESDLIELQVRGRRGRGKKNRVINLFREVRSVSQKSLDRGAGRLELPMGLQIPAPNLLVQNRSLVGVTFFLGSNMDKDMEQMMERDLTQTQPTTNDGSIISTAPSKLGTASWHAGGENVNIFAAQRANIEHQNNGNEMNIPQQGHFAAQRADGLRFQLLMGLEQEQSEDEPEHDLGQLNLNNLSENPGNEGPSGLTQETRRSEANKGSTKSRSKSSRKKKKGR